MNIFAQINSKIWIKISSTKNKGNISLRIENTCFYVRCEIYCSYDTYVEASGS